MQTKKIDHRSWRYKNSVLALLSIILAVVLYKYEPLHQLLFKLSYFGYFGAFLSGILFVWTFTAATGALLLLILVETLSPIQIGLVAGLGAIVGDLLIFRFVKDGLAGEINNIYNHIDHKKHLKKLFRSKYFSWTLPVIGAIIIASPLPDELGVSLISISRMSTPKFVFLSYILNSIGIFLIISASVIIKP